MPRQNSASKLIGTSNVKIVLNGVSHTLSEDAFIAFMEQALNVLQAIVATRKRT